MPDNFSSEYELLRTEIAAAAARLIAEDGADYSTAKRKAAKQILGNQRVRGDILPDNAQVEDEVRAYNALFFADTQPARLQHLRRLALELMEELAEFSPYLSGAVLNGTAGEHSDIHLQLFADSPKDVEIYLMNKGIDFDVSELEHFRTRTPVEIVSFIYRGDMAHLNLYQPDDLRSMPKNARRGERADADALRTLIANANGCP